MSADAVRAGLEALARTALESAALADRVAAVAARYAGTLRAGVANQRRSRGGDCGRLDAGGGDGA